MALRWTELNSSVVRGEFPAPRRSAGFAAAGDSLYLFGGLDSTGTYVNYKE